MATKHHRREFDSIVPRDIQAYARDGTRGDLQSQSAAGLDSAWPSGAEFTDNHDASSGPERIPNAGHDFKRIGVATSPRDSVTRTGVIRGDGQAGGAGAASDANRISQLLQTSSSAIAPAERAFFEPRFGHNFSQVRVHTDERAARSADAVSARAYTLGDDIVFGAGQYAPGTQEGRRLLGHELTHTIQQASTVPATGPGAAAAGSDAFEREAHRVGDIVATGGSATPTLHTGQMMVQGYGGPEHQAMGDDVHQVLEAVLMETDDLLAGVCRVPEFGGVSSGEMSEQQWWEEHGRGASHAPGLGHVGQADSNGRVEVPQLAQMLEQDAFFRDRGRSLTVPLRNFQMQNDVAGPYLAIETDPTTKEAVRYDAPVSPGDLTALNGDLYGSMENLRKAPVSEFITLQGILDAEARWERMVAGGTADSKNAPNFTAQWEAATSWRGHKVYSDGHELGQEATATGGDTASYLGLALDNRAHFGQDTEQKIALEVQVRSGDLGALARGPQGNFAQGNEQAWMAGHARALTLAQEAHALKAPESSGLMTPDRVRALSDPYGHEALVPPTGLLTPEVGNKVVPSAPSDADGRKLQRSSGVPTFESKRNDAYVENAGADHYLTDAYAAGHQIVRDVIGRVTDQFVNDQGGRDAFLGLVVRQIQAGAIADPEKAEGELGEFQEASHTWKDKAARGESWLNSKWNVLRFVGIGAEGLKQKLDKELDAPRLHAIGAKLVHDYYNRRGLLVHNAKGMTFMIKGDGSAEQAPAALRIIELAILESRTQITEMANNGATANPMAVWDYTPALDKTLFTETSGRKVLDLMFQDSEYLWHLIKDNFSVTATADTTAYEKAASQNAVQEPMPGRGLLQDPGTPPLQSWLERRRQYVQQHGRAPSPGPQPPGVPVPLTPEGLELPGARTVADDLSAHI